MAPKGESDDVEPERRRSSLPVLGALAVVALVIGGVVVSNVLSPPEENISEEDRVGTLITEYVEARSSGDAAQLAALLCASDTTQPFAGHGDGIELENFDPPALDGSSATTRVTVKFGDEEVEEPMTFQQTDGTWTVCGA